MAVDVRARGRPASRPHALDTPLPDTGDLRRDLAAVANRVAATLATPMSQAMVHLVAGTTDDHLIQAAAGYWSTLFDHTAEVVRRAQRRGQATADIDPLAAVESLLAPIYLRVLVTRQPITTPFLESLVERTTRMLEPW
jgi:Tetracyclin repressor-like, C-terminal domain